MPESDEQLLKSYADTGSEAAFCAIVDRYTGMVMASALRRTGEQGLAEDVTQRVFLILARKAKSLQSHPAIRAWLHTTARLQCQSVLRSERRQQRKRQALMNESPPPAAPPECRLDDRQPVLDEALDELNESDRRLILLRFVDELSYAELSSRMSKSEVACRKRVSRVLQKLSRLLRRKGLTVPGTVIGGIIATQLGKSSASGIGAAVTPGILTNLSVISTPTLIINTLETMAFGKTKAFAVAAVLAAIPLSLQWRENAQLQHQLASRSSVVSVDNGTAAGNSAAAEETIEEQHGQVRDPNERIPYSEWFTLATAPKPNRKQLAAFVESRGRSLESLIAAASFHVADGEFLQQAMALYPDDPQVQFFVLTSHAELDPSERVEWVGRLKKSMPHNGIANFLAAQAKIGANDLSGALDELRAIPERAEIEYLQPALSRGRTDALLHLGYPYLQARGWGRGNPLPRTMQEAAHEIRNAVDSGLSGAARDEAIALGLTFGNRLSQGDGSGTLENELVGMTIEAMFLAALDPEARPPFLETTVAEAQKSLRDQRSAIIANIEELSHSEISENELLHFMDREEKDGLSAAVEWLQKAGSPMKQ